MAIGLTSALGLKKVHERIATEWDRIERPTPYCLNNDLFWADQAVTYLPGFKVASIEEGLRFAFEAVPRTCYEINNRQLPFGCHAWTKFDRGFWEPHLLPADEPLPLAR